MNLALLERMVGEGDLSRAAFQYLLQCRAECEWLDYKETLDLSTENGVCGFAKDILALKNVGGGYLLIGVRDKTWEQVGLGSPIALDTKQLRDQIIRATGVTLEIDIVHHELERAGSPLIFALILVRGSKKRNKRRMPTLVGKDFCASKPFGLRRGEIFVRSGDSTVKVTKQAELEVLLERLEAQADEASVVADAPPSPFAIEDGLYRLLDRGFERFVGRSELRDRLVSAVLGDPRLWIVNVHGPGGVGKSALVNWATYRMYEERRFEAILQLTAKETILTDAGIQRHSRSLFSLDNLLDQILLLFEESSDADLDRKKELATELLTAWPTLLVLDNMETVSDGRILSFVQALPPSTLARVVLTSRTKSGGWELPIPVVAMSTDEVEEFVRIKSEELKVHFPLDPATLRRVSEVSGGLPLASQWIIGQYRRSKNLDKVLSQAQGKDSPVLEFSFRNTWRLLAPEAKTILSLMSIFDGPTTVQQLTVASEMRLDGIERALSELEEVTLVNRVIGGADGQARYSALPITLSFARNELAGMGELELRARQRLQRYNEQMELQASEVARFTGEFERYGISTPNEKRAAILCRQAESAMFGGNADIAEQLFLQARELAPQSAYVLARAAMFELARNRVGVALERAIEACDRASRRTGALCYSVKARVLDVKHDKGGRVEALQRAVSFEPDDTVLRHQYGVALSRAGLEREAIDVFSAIIAAEEARAQPRETLIMALTTRIINLRRLKRDQDAESDLKRARELIAAHPHLASAGRKLDQLE